LVAEGKVVWLTEIWEFLLSGTKSL